MCKLYYLCTYSFDPDITVVGPFDSEHECFEAADRDACKEYDNSLKNGILRSDRQTNRNEPQYVLKRNIRTSRVPLYISLDECADTACLAAAKRFDFEAASAEQERIFKEYGDFYKIIEVAEKK